MKKYIDPENERYQYMVRETRNGYALQVLIVPTGDIVDLTASVAAQLLVALPSPCRLQSCRRENAEKELDRVAALNGWVAVESQD